MSKKVPRAKRRELREQGVYEPPSRVSRATRAAERRAEEAATSARTRAARDEIVAEEEAAPSVAEKPAPTRDRTIFVLFGLTALAGLIFWLTQRSPSKTEAKISVGAPVTEPAKAAPSSTTKP